MLALVPAAGILVRTHALGLALSPDAIAYLYAAESLRDRGRLVTPYVEWWSGAEEEVLYHHAPLLPIVLAAASLVSGVSVPEAARWINAFCFGGTALLALSLVRPRSPAVLLVAAVLIGPSIYPSYFSLWSEPVYLLLLVLAVSCARPTDPDRLSVARAIGSGALLGGSVLARYVGMFAAPAGCLLIGWGAGECWLVRLRKAAVFLLAFLAVCLPWFLFLTTVDRPPRRFGLHTANYWPQLKWELSSTVSTWLLPASIPFRWRFDAFVFIVVLAGLALWRVRPRGVGSPLPVATATLAASYFAFVCVSRLIAGSTIPFDDRMLGPAALLLAIAVASTLALARLTFAYNAAIVAVAAWLAFNGWSNWVRQMDKVVRTKAIPEAVMRLKDLPREARIYSNAPEHIVKYLWKPVRITPSKGEESRLPEFERTLASETPSALVLFLHGWERLVERDRIVKELSLPEPVVRGDPMLFLWDSRQRQ